MENIKEVLNKRTTALQELENLLSEYRKTQQNHFNRLQSIADTYDLGAQDNDNPRSSVPNSDNRS